MSPIDDSTGQVDDDWEYFRFPPGLVTVKMIPIGDNTFEFVMVVRDYFSLFSLAPEPVPSQMIFAPRVYSTHKSMACLHTLLQIF